MGSHRVMCGSGSSGACKLTGHPFECRTSTPCVTTGHQRTAVIDEILFNHSEEHW